VARAPETLLRWHTNPVSGEQVHQYEVMVLSPVLAFEVSAVLDEYKHTSPDFPVHACMHTSKCGGDMSSRVQGNRNTIPGGSTR
jgi:hypothetical protein